MSSSLLPHVTVVMPIRNEAAFIARGLGAVLAQNYAPARLDVIVADGQSDDGTAAIVSAMAAADRRVTLIDNPGRIVATGLNRALAMAKGQIVVRVDGHCEIAPDYVRRCVEHLSRGEVVGVGGPLDTVGETPTARAIAAAMSSTFGVGNSAFRTLKGASRLVDTVAFPAYTREAIERAGPFDVELVRNQDDEYNYRLRGLGGRLLLAADVRARYYSRGSLWSLCRQYFQYGFWKVRVLQKHRRQMSARQFAPPLFVLALVALPWIPGGWLAWLAMLGAYLVANVLASIAVARTAREWTLLGVVPLAFAILHLSYGSGFLVGLVRFLNRWGTEAGPGSLPSSAVKPLIGSPRSMESPK